jgi:hypothetical protein
MRKSLRKNLNQLVLNTKNNLMVGEVVFIKGVKYVVISKSVKKCN